MRKILVLIICLMLSVTILVACGEAENNNNQGNANNGGVQNGGNNNQGTIEDDKLDLSDLKYKYNMDDYIELSSYQGFEAELLLDSIQQKIDTYILEKAIKSKNTICMMGDVVNVTYFGYRIDENGEILYENGKPVTFNQSESYGVYLGSKMAIDEFENAIIGMKIGETKEVYVTFPDDYFQKDLAGETVIFEIILNAIYEAPIYNDEFVKKNFPGYNTVAEFEEGLKKELILEKLYAYINEGCVVKAYPEKEYNDLAAELEKVSSQFKNQYGMTLDEYLKNVYDMTREEYIKSEIKKEMILYALAKIEGISPSEESLLAERESLINYYKDYYMSEGASANEALSLAKDVVKDLGSNYIYENVMFEALDEKMMSYISSVNTTLQTYKSITQVLSERENAERGTTVGSLCPSFEAEVFDENGSLDTTLDPSKNVGKLTVINLWGTWCGPCKSELPDFDRVASEYADQVTIYAIHSSYNYAEASEYVEKNFLNSNIIFMKDYAIDPNDSYSDDAFYKLLGGDGYYPYTIVLDENGIIRATHTGMMSYSQLVNILTNLGLEK